MRCPAKYTYLIFDSMVSIYRLYLNLNSCAKSQRRTSTEDKRHVEVEGSSLRRDHALITSPHGVCVTPGVNAGMSFAGNFGDYKADADRGGRCGFNADEESDEFSPN